MSFDTSESIVTELAESWINGNKAYVINELEALFGQDGDIYSQPKLTVFIAAGILHKLPTNYDKQTFLNALENSFGVN